MTAGSVSLATTIAVLTPSNVYDWRSRCVEFHNRYIMSTYIVHLTVATGSRRRLRLRRVILN
jgi:hypothetical protein